MRLIDVVHQGYVHDRRTRVLSGAIAELLPENARVLDIGCGDGLVAHSILQRRKDVTIEGIDVLVRPKPHIPVTHFDGSHIPSAAATFDAAILIDVLHHTDDPSVLLREAARVSRMVIIKDHRRDGFLAGPTLRFMDSVGNARHGVSIPANYWAESRWRETFADLKVEVCTWRENLPLYPWWASWVFGRSLHFLASVTPQSPGPVSRQGG
jgi:SAM-dependent methyltransferase